MLQEEEVQNKRIEKKVIRRGAAGKGADDMKKKPLEIRFENTDVKEEKSDVGKDREKVIKALSNMFADKKSQKYIMNTEKTIEKLAEQYSDKGPEAQEFYESRLKAGKNSHVRLKGTAEDFYLTGNEASGQFVTEELPGENVEERKENLQLPPSNDAEDVYKVRLKEAHVVIESTVAEQKDFAKRSGYKARDGIKQIFIPPKYGDRSPIVEVIDQVDGTRPHTSALNRLKTQKAEQNSANETYDSHSSEDHKT